MFIGIAVNNSALDIKQGLTIKNNKEKKEGMMELLAVILCLVLCLVLHEVGHALAALACKRRIKFLINRVGFALRHDGKAPLTPWQKIVITIAGPGTNIIAGLVALILGWTQIAMMQFLFGVINLLWLSRKADGYRAYREVRQLLIGLRGRSGANKEG
ncbi:MAG: M50 family metallopeptidase [Candidatus Nealsonbacteria bacterium]